MIEAGLHSTSETYESGPRDTGRGNRARTLQNRNGLRLTKSIPMDGPPALADRRFGRREWQPV
jgi:hypothetical protein